MQCDIEVPKSLRSKFDNFIPIFKNTLVSESDIGDLMKNCAEEERLLSQPPINADIQFYITKWNTYYSSAVFLSTIGSCLHKNTLFC